MLDRFGGFGGTNDLKNSDRRGLESVRGFDDFGGMKFLRF